MKIKATEKKTQEFEFGIEDIDQIYHGQGNCCRCGCGGDYYTPREDKEKVEELLKRFERLAWKGVDNLDNYIFEVEVDSYTKRDEDGYEDDYEEVICIYLKEPI